MQGKGNIPNNLKISLQDDRWLILHMSLTTFFWSIKIFLLCGSFPHIVIPYLSCVICGIKWAGGPHTRCSVLLHRPVSYTSHDLPGQELFRSYGSESDVCIHPPHNIKTIKNWQLWRFIVMYFNIKVL